MTPTPWLATAYVAGQALDDARRKARSVTVASVLSDGVGLAEALRSNHEAGIKCPRDLKPPTCC